MARNGSGTYSLPAGNPVVTGTVISSTVHNNTMSDIASELTNSTDKDGQTVITGAWDYNGNEIVLDADGDTSITADTDDQIDIKIASADDFQFVANIFKALSGSSIETDTISETTAANGVAIDSVTLKDGSVVLSSAKGIDFSATSDGAGTATSELLDDYEEGTWVPDLWDGSNSASYSGRTGYYVKIGRLVLFSCFLDISTLGSVSGSVRIQGLPYNASNDTNSYGGCWPITGQGWTITAGQVPVGEVRANTDEIYLGLWDATTGPSALQHTEVNATGNQIWAGFYFV